MQRSAPFARSKVMMALIATAMAVSDMAKKREMLAGIPAYVSRGKGEGRSNRSARGAGMASVRAARKARNVRRHRAACR